MATLSHDLRKALERAVVKARGEAEAGARKALEQLAVGHRDAWPTMTTEQQGLRRRLRARGRQLGDRLEDGGKQRVEHLVSEFAYEHWHRMLFARFLAECSLLIEPASRVPVSVEECKELARERGVDWISLASNFAQGMLPRIFRADDALLETQLPAEHRQPLEQLLTSLPVEVFLADDSLGWVYQFWQSQEKDRVNKSERKIGADGLPAVTQLFTEDYMVNFLLHNTLGAWWMALHFPDGVLAGSEMEARAAVALPGITWDFLRLVTNDSGQWHPAAGAFSTWPRSSREVRLLDPCMGSGHFLVAALPLLGAMRAAEEQVPIPQAYAAVLRDNLYGLELDARCTQIGAFNLALAAWKLGGWQQLPPLNLACSGIAPSARRQDWLHLAANDDHARSALERLYDLFAQAPTLGSLINPSRLDNNLFAKNFRAIQPLLEKALLNEQDEHAHALAVAAQGITEAAGILSRDYTLIVTNVPYLKSRKQDDTLKRYCEDWYADAKADLATVFVRRCFELCGNGGSVAVVSQQHWRFLGSYKSLRKHFLNAHSLHFVTVLGPGAFETIGGEMVNVMLMSASEAAPTGEHSFFGIDVTDDATVMAKAGRLTEAPPTRVSQKQLLTTPDARIVFGSNRSHELLAVHAVCLAGIQNGDSPRFQRLFWEVPKLNEFWHAQQGTVDGTELFAGRELIIFYDRTEGHLREDARVRREKLHDSDQRGNQAWGKIGVVVSQMGNLPVTLYSGDLYDQSCAVILPRNADLNPAIWAFCSSSFFADAVREIDESIKVTPNTLVKIPFDLSHWQKVAADAYPAGLPKPHTNDATQWLFDGHPNGSRQPLHVAVARLVGYRWPRQTGSSFLECPALNLDGLEDLADQDGVVCISAIKGEEGASDRLRSLLARAVGAVWSAQKLEELLAQVGYPGKTLDDWLRHGFFEQHCDLFHQRPFIWHIWDGRRDGFSALVNYHKFSRANLEKLAYAYLGDWINRQRSSGEPGSDARLVAALQLQKALKEILDGEPPHDLFVRWKSLANQAIGWEPDLDDGVRINIRPFMLAPDVGKKGAGLLRTRPNIAWDKDRGKESLRSKDEFPWLWGWDGTTKDFAGDSKFDGNRWNDLHYSRESKLAARRGGRQ